MIYTSYFAYFNNKQRPENLISIATGSPKWFGEINKYPDLAPGWGIVNPYKTALKKIEQKSNAQIEGAIITNLQELKDWYICTYYQDVLSNLDPLKVYEDLDNKIILCYEKPGDFCHRYIVASWLEINLGTVIHEFKN